MEEWVYQNDTIIIYNIESLTPYVAQCQDFILRQIFSVEFGFQLILNL